mmetsp:Transcript_58138/g.173509  ORF Transcript_58138/g.173509 Transcript_58138/m.173509 type:complete len:115 (+) Transcript_58138:758-1102(+)
MRVAKTTFSVGGEVAQLPPSATPSPPAREDMTASRWSDSSTFPLREKRLRAAKRGGSEREKDPRPSPSRSPVDEIERDGGRKDERSSTAASVATEIFKSLRQRCRCPPTKRRRR